MLNFDLRHYKCMRFKSWFFYLKIIAKLLFDEYVVIVDGNMKWWIERILNCEIWFRMIRLSNEILNWSMGLIWIT